jgi:putative DNA primase/helicase
VTGNIKKPLLPVLAVETSTGVGKSFTMRASTAKWLRERRATGETGSVVVLVPTHRLSGEQVYAFNQDHPDLIARQYRGIGQPDPRDGERKMCRRASVATELTRNGGSIAEICAKPRSGEYCPYHIDSGVTESEACGYSRQAQLRADYWWMPQQLLFHSRPACIPKEPALLVVDETVWQSAIKHAEGFTVPTLEVERTVPHKEEARAKLHTATLMEFSLLITEWLERQSDGFLDVPSLIQYVWDDNPDISWTSHAEDTFRQMHKLEMRRLGAVKVSPSMTRSQLREAAERMHKGAARKLADFWLLLAQSAGIKGTTPYVEKRTIDGDEGRSVMLYMHQRMSINKGWAVPTILLDATLQPKLNTVLFPSMQVEQITCGLRHTTVTQITDSALSKVMFTRSPENLKRLKWLLQVLCSRISGVGLGLFEPKVLLICPMNVEEQLKEIGLPDEVDTLHYNAVSGLDQYKHVPAIVVAGRLELPPADAEHLAALMRGEWGERLPKETWYDREHMGIETVEDIVGVDATRHPDPLAEEVRWGVNEGQLIQSIGRGRGVRRTWRNPLELFVLTNVPLPIVVDKTMEIKQMWALKIERIIAKHGICPLGYGELRRIFPKAFGSREITRKEVTKFLERYPEAASGAPSTLGRGGVPLSIYINNRQRNTTSAPKHQMRLFERLILIEYQPIGRGKRPSLAVIRPNHDHSSVQSLIDSIIGETKAPTKRPITPPGAVRTVGLKPDNPDPLQAEVPEVRYRIIRAVVPEPQPMPSWEQSGELWYEPEDQQWLDTQPGTYTAHCHTSGDRVSYTRVQCGV